MSLERQEPPARIVVVDASDEAMMYALADLALSLDVRHRDEAQRAAGGFLTLPSTFGPAMLKTMATLPSVAALDHSGRPVGFMFASTADLEVQSPVVKGAIDCFARSPYASLSLAVYGPIGVAESQQGRGLAQAMFRFLVARLKAEGRQAMLAFVDQANAPSMTLHLDKLGFQRLGEYHINGRGYAAILRDLRA